MAFANSPILNVLRLLLNRTRCQINIGGRVRKLSIGDLIQNGEYLPLTLGKVVQMFFDGIETPLCPGAKLVDCGDSGENELQQIHSL